MRLFLSILVILIFTSCEDRCLNSIGQTIEEQRAVGTFEKIEIFDQINLTWHYDSTYNVVVQAGENLVPNIHTEVSDGWLIIENRNTCNFLRSYDHEINVHVYSPELKQIDCANSGNIYSEDTIVTRHFQFNQWSASGVNAIIVNSDTVSLKLHTGTGDLSASGSCDQFYLYSASYGSMECQNLKARNGWVTSRSTGQVFLNVENRLEAFLYSQGNVTLSSEPSTINSVVEGDGQILID